MDAERKSVGLRKKAAQQRQSLFEIAEKFEEQKVFERLTQSQRDELDEMYRGYQSMYGPVAYQYWLRAVVRSMRGNIQYLNKVLVFELQPRSEGDVQKIKFLDVMAQQMGLDVTITNNRVPKSPKARRKIPERRKSHDD